MTDLRCGLIGYSLGWEQHGRRHGTYINAADGLLLAAVCDLNPDATAKARDDFPGITTFADRRDLLADGGIDVVSVITPHHLHHPLALVALEAGNHVVIDKPMCFTLEQADGLLRAAATAGRVVTTFFNRRRDGNFRKIQEIVRSGEIGTVKELRLTSESRGAHPTAWRNSKSQSGGILYESLGAHAFDWVLQLMPGDRVTGVTGVLVPSENGDDASEIHARAWLRFESGAIADITLSRMSQTGQPLWQITGTDGTMLDTGRNATKNYLYPFPVVAEAPGSLTIRKVEDGDAVDREVAYSQSAWGTYYADLAKCLHGGGQPPVTESECRRVVAVMEAVTLSARTGETRSVDGE